MGIRIRIDLDPGKQKLPTKIGKREEIHVLKFRMFSLEEQRKASQIAWTSFMEVSV
jgi:hypothetical protein